MASLHKHKDSPYWYCAFTLPNGKRRLKSTRTRDKAVAKVICQKWADLTESMKSCAHDDTKLLKKQIRIVSEEIAKTALSKKKDPGHPSQ